MRRASSVAVFVVFVAALMSLPPAREFIAWKKACSRNTEEAYLNYLSAWPAGPHRAEAATRADELAWTTLHPSDYLDRYASGRYVAIAKKRIERNDWNAAQATNSIYRYEQYLEHHPTGPFSADARERLAKLKQAEAENDVLRRWVRLHGELATLNERTNQVDDRLSTFSDRLTANLRGTTLEAQQARRHAARNTSPDAAVLASTRQLLLGAAKDTRGPRALFLAIEADDHHTVKLLLDGGVNITSRNAYGQTPLELAEQRGNSAILRLLRTRLGSAE